MLRTEIMFISLSRTSSQGLVQQEPLRVLLQNGWRVEGVLPQSAFEWTLIVRRRRWFWPWASK